MGQDQEAVVKEMMAEGLGDRKIAGRLGITRHRARTIMAAVREAGADDLPRTTQLKAKHADREMDVSAVVRATSQSQSLEALIEDAEIDLTKWRVTWWIANMWGNPRNPSWQVKAKLEPRDPLETSAEEILERIKRESPPGFIHPHTRPYCDSDRALEIDLMDVHYGLRCFAPAACEDYNPTTARFLVKSSLELILERSKPFGPFDEIILPIGNDFMHHDNVFHTTTAGTHQPEADAWHHTFVQAKELLIDAIIGLTEHATRVVVPVVPGNHDRHSAFALGQVMEARFHNDHRVEVDASAAPYKFHRFGVNLTGYEHGHSIKPKDLPGIFMNECKNDLQYVKSLRWHCADQHREAPRFGDHGIVTKFCPSFVAANEWHKLKGFSWAHRAVIGHVYDAARGCICQPQVNANEVYL